MYRGHILGKNHGWDRLLGGPARLSLFVGETHIHILRNVCKRERGETEKPLGTKESI